MNLIQLRLQLPKTLQLQVELFADFVELILN